MRSLVGATFALGALFAETSARANPMDLAPERLTYCDPTSPVACGGARSPFGPGDTNYYKADNVAWAKLMSQYAMAIAPPAMHQARTTGYGGFQLSLYGTFTTISKDEAFIKQGTEGAITDGKKFPSSNNSPDGVLSVFGVTGRKGLPYGFELQGSVGYIANTELVTMGGGIRLAPFEGFRKWFDLSVGGYVNTLTGTNKVKMTVPALDVQGSRPFVIANQVILQPYLGWQIIWINVDSGVIDATPQFDGLGKCNARPSNPTERTAGDTGEFNCQERANNGTGQITGDAAKGSATATNKLDLNNNVVFRNMRSWTRNRLFFGLAGRWEHLHWVIPHVALELSDPAAGEPEPDKCPAGVSFNNTNSCGKKRLDGLARQTMFGASVGLEW
ncbi:MAG: hypothetical protein ACXVEF_28480 [Polyangiales bacterium]